MSIDKVTSVRARRSVGFPPILNALSRAVAGTGLPAGEREYRFCRDHQWHFDLAWPDLKVAIEYKGGQSTKGRHMRPRGYVNDCRKYNRAAIEGWIMVRATRSMADDGSALLDLLEALSVRKKHTWDDVAGVEII